MLYRGRVFRGWRRASARRQLVLLLVAAAVVLGVLGMHQESSVDAAAGDQPLTHRVTAVDGAADMPQVAVPDAVGTLDHGFPADTSPNFGGACPDVGIVAACMLAFVVLVAWLIVPSVGRSFPGPPVGRNEPEHRRPVWRAALSLQQLCVSRT